jgi:hypothetical protein
MSTLNFGGGKRSKIMSFDGLPPWRRISNVFLEYAINKGLNLFIRSSCKVWKIWMNSARTNMLEEYKVVKMQREEFLKTKISFETLIGTKTNIESQRTN